jgi:hypothetical protein
MTALHAPEPTTPHLSLLARVRTLTVDDVEAALYEQRELVRVMAMRRTLFVVTRELVPAVIGSAGRRVADAEVKRLSKEAADHEAVLGTGWIAAASDEIVEHLTGRELSTRELRDALAHLGGTFTAAPGTKWSAEVPTMSRLMTILTANGLVVRGHNAGEWRISRPLWTSMASWLGHQIAPPDSGAGYTELVRHWLHTFGPATEADLVWWLGATKAVARAALAAVSAEQVVLESGQTGWVLAGDTADLERPADLEPWVALLPTLDPTTMGWRERDFHLDPAHTPYLFDRAGNGGTTVWVNGRIIGCWVQDDDGRVRLVLVEQPSRALQRMLDTEVARVDSFLGGQRITNVFASPQMRQERLR